MTKKEFEENIGKPARIIKGESYFGMTHCKPHNVEDWIMEDESLVPHYMFIIQDEGRDPLWMPLTEDQLHFVELL